MRNIPKVAVILSVYNGEKFLNELLDSIKNQADVETFLYIRDDESTDDSRMLIKQYMDNNINVLYLEDDYGNIGPASSFHRLLQFAIASGPHQFFAFCDQDDIWLPQKLASAVSNIQNHKATIPILYCSAITYFDNHKKTKKIMFANDQYVCFKNALVENLAIGATIVINRSAATLLAREIPCISIGFDSWSYLVTSYLGLSIYDSESRIHYRRHPNTYTKFSFRPISYNKIISFLNARDKVFLEQAIFLQMSEFYPNGNQKNREILDSHISALNGNFLVRAKYILSGAVWRSKKIDRIFFSLSTLLK